MGRDPMTKIRIGKNPNDPGGYTIIGESGKDITKELQVKRIVITAEPDNLTKAKLEIYVDEVDIDTNFVAVEIVEDGKNP